MVGTARRAPLPTLYFFLPGALAGIELLHKILIYGFYFQSRFDLLTNLLVQLLLSSYELWGRYEVPSLVAVCLC